jgi:hypothetical protein
MYAGRSAMSDSEAVVESAIDNLQSEMPISRQP